MNRLFALLLAALPCVWGCSSTVTYHPADKPDAAEFDRDLVDVYPGDVRQHLALYSSVGVGWAGIIQSNQVTQTPDGLLHAVTYFEHRYYDWQEQKSWGRGHVSVSPRGEGFFKTEVVYRRTDPYADPSVVGDYAAPGSLAIVYGVPQSVESNGVVVLKYRYLRVIPEGSYSISQFDYGRFDEPVRYRGKPGAAP